MNPHPKTSKDQAARSESVTEGSGKGVLESKKSKRTWLLAGVGTVFLLLLLTFIGIKAWRWLRKPSSLEPADGRVFLLVNQNSGRCLSVKNGSADPGAPIIQGPTPDKARASERWILLKVSNGVFRLLNENSQKVLEIPAGNKNRGVQALQWHDGFTLPHQHWEFERVGEDYILRVRHSQQVLAIGQAAKDEGAAAVQWDYAPEVPDQLWKLQTPNP